MTSSITDLLADIVDKFTPTVAYAIEDNESADPAEPEESSEDTPAEEEESSEDTEEAEEEDDEEEEDEDEDEPEDIAPAIQEEALEGPCHEFKHHFEECVERVTAAQQEPDYADREYKEDCVEEFFHQQHCINEHTANVIFNKLK